MTREERLKALFDELEKDAYNAEYHNYYYKEANQIIRKHFELSLPPAEGAEEILRKPKYNSLKNLTLICEAMEEFAPLHAQRLAEKMVEEKLRKELMRYNAYLYEHNYTDTDIWAEAPNPADEYLKSRKP